MPAMREREHGRTRHEAWGFSLVAVSGVREQLADEGGGMNATRAILTGVYGFLVAMGFAGAAVAAMMAAGLIAWVFKHIGGRDDG